MQRKPARSCGLRVLVVGELAERLHRLFGMARLVVQLGADGAVMLNGIPCPYRVHTCPVFPAEFELRGTHFSQSRRWQARRALKNRTLLHNR